MVPESYHFETLRIQPFCSSMVLLLPDSMLPAIQLDDQALFKANKIEDKFSDWGLPPEFEALHLAVSYMPP